MFLTQNIAGDGGKIAGFYCNIINQSKIKQIHITNNII